MNTYKEKVVLVLGHSQYNTVVNRLGFKILNRIPRRSHETDTDVFNVYDVQFVLFTGGADVSPQLYTTLPDRFNKCYNNLDRDTYEVFVFKETTRRGIPHAGICRGSQFLCAMNGGLIVQDIDNHAISNTHPIVVTTPLGDHTINVTSTHHQMQWPFNLKPEEYNLIGYAEGRGTCYLLPDKEDYNYINNNPLPQEPEIVYYKKYKSLAIQYHPEYMSQDSSGFLLAEALIISTFDGKEGIGYRV